MESFQFVDIILLAMVAGFLVLRLRSNLGRRTGHEQGHKSFSSDKVVRINKNDETQDFENDDEESSEETQQEKFRISQYNWCQTLPSNSSQLFLHNLLC